jgi:hypothetical protein
MKADPAVIEALGSPIKEGFLLSENTDVNGAVGESNLAIPISRSCGQSCDQLCCVPSQPSRPVRFPGG